MIRFRTLLAAAAFIGASSTAFAQPLTVVNQGENFEVQYEEGYSGNVVGGGAVRVTGNGESQRISYLDNDFAQHSAGIPIFTGGSEGTVVYNPTPSSVLMAGR